MSDDEAATPAKMDVRHCAGCYNDEYNRGLGGAAECWHRKNAVVILRRRVHIDDVPPWDREPEQLPSCYTQRRYVFVKPDQER